MTVQRPRHAERLTDSPRTRAQVPRPASPSGHHVQPIHGVHCPDEHGTRITLLASHHVEAPVDPIAEIHIGEPSRAEHGGVAARPTGPGRRVRGRIGQSEVRLDLDDDTFGSRPGYGRHEPATKEIRGHLLSRPNEEVGAKDLRGGRAYPPACRLQAHRPRGHGRAVRSFRYRTQWSHASTLGGSAGHLHAPAEPLRCAVAPDATAPTGCR